MSTLFPYTTLFRSASRSSRLSWHPQPSLVLLFAQAHDHETAAPCPANPPNHHSTPLNRRSQAEVRLPYWDRRTSPATGARAERPHWPPVPTSVHPPW